MRTVSKNIHHNSIRRRSSSSLTSSITKEKDMSISKAIHRCYPSKKVMKIYFTAAALTATLSSFTHTSSISRGHYVHAFQMTPPLSSYTTITYKQSPLQLTTSTGAIKASSNSQQYNHRKQHTRLFFSNRNEPEKDETILKKATDKLKDLVPSFLKPKSTKITQKEKAKNEVSSSIDTMLKDAPLGIRMMGKMISPLISSVAGNIAEAMEEQSKQLSDLMDDAKMYIISDSNVVNELGGEPIQIGMPFSQSSSTTNINGKMSSSVNSSFEVRGRRSGGVATMSAANGQIQQLVIDVNGKRLYVNLSGSPSQKRTTVDASSSTFSGSKGGSPGLGKNRVINDDEIIDAEFVEKKVNK